MDSYLHKLINEYHEKDRHDEIIRTILSTGKKNLEYTEASYLARAYNKSEDYQRAVDILIGFEEQGKDDPLWHLRLVHAYTGLGRSDKVVFHAEEFIRLDALHADEALTLPADAYPVLDEIEKAEHLIKKYSLNGRIPYLYDRHEREAVERHISMKFGGFRRVIHEVYSPDIQVDIMVIEPDERHEYYTLVTMGMGAYRMNVPDELAEQKVNRAELVVCLPHEWNISSSDEKFYWPLRWLKMLARLPLVEGSWLGWGHTVPNGAAFADNTCLSGILLEMPYRFGEESFVCELPSGEAVNFYQMVPLYEEEMDYKIEFGAAALLGLFNDGFSDTVDVRRRNYCKSDQDDHIPLFLN